MILFLLFQVKMLRDAGSVSLSWTVVVVVVVVVEDDREGHLHSGKKEEERYLRLKQGMVG